MDAALPEAFVAILRSYGDGFAAPLLKALATQPSVSVRANTLKSCRPLPTADPVPWCGAGFYLPSRPIFAADPAWHQGLYYVQDASSMAYGAAVEAVVGRYFGNADGLRYLDACAAPGGKTIAAVEALPPSALVVSNELDRHRANILLENVVKEGAPNVLVSQGDATAYAVLGEAFDIIAVDAPCSGEGMMRKEPEAIRQWSEGLVESCAATQRQIVGRLWNALKPGGVLLYSTCTFNRTENELNVAHFIDELGAESVPLGLDRYPGVITGLDTPHHCYRFAPGHVRGEGLFMAALRKPGEYAPGGNVARERRRKTAKLAPEAAAFVSGHIRSGAEGFSAGAEGSDIVLRPAQHEAFIASVTGRTRLLRNGLTVATLKGRDYVPTHGLALSTLLDAASFPHLDLGYREAMDYLRGEALADVPSSLPKGFALACHGGRPLGFLKNIGRRANNLYPETMRLRLDGRNLPVRPIKIIDIPA